MTIKEVAEIKHKTMLEVILFNKPQMIIRGTKPAISFNRLLCTVASTTLNTKDKKKQIKNFKVGCVGIF